ncbi:MAG: MoaD/ThiS family protein [Nocardioides sp.]
MTVERESEPGGERIRVRYWASARAVAGTAEELVPTVGRLSLTELRDLVAARHPGPEFAAVLSVCAVLHGDRPVASEDADSVLIAAGDTVEFLPPFAGG